MADQKSFGNSTIEILLDGNSGELRQWTLLDESGRDTTVVVHNIKINTPMPKHIFRIPYKNIRERN
jgi:outer membrane lipoprotein-sorting protein